MKKTGNELHCIKYEDPSHGWLGVKLEMVRLSGVEISPYSYQRGKTAYLEEDSDAPAFIRAIEAKGFKVFRESRHTNKTSPIRSYAQFSR
jgi:hypothetical protein